MSFKAPVKVGDTLSVYTAVKKVGHTSMTLKLEAWAQRYLSADMVKVTEAEFIMVALGANGKPVAIRPG